MEGKYNFLKLEKIILRNFSLYKKDGKINEVNEEIGGGVYCLAGANGLGKTTFLNSINYGLTGIVLEPNREVFSPLEISNANKKYTERYYKGRIRVEDEKKAEIEISFTVNNTNFRIIRNFFERDELRLLEIYKLQDNKKIPLFNDIGESPKELNKRYQDTLANAIGFVSFDYFMFYQLYILTFDENRRMIFWDDRASSNALAVAFNSNPKDAEKISDLTRRMEKHESNGRNARWQATQSNNKVKELKEKTKDSKNDNNQELEKYFNDLNKDLAQSEKTFLNIEIEYDTMLKRQSHLNSEIMYLKIEHTKLFSRYSEPRSKLLENVNVQLSIKNQKCCVCDSHGNYIVENINKSLHKDSCPLCNTLIDENNSEEQNKLLLIIQKNDENISRKNTELESLIYEVEGKKNELEKSKFALDKVKVNLDKFIKDNSSVSFKGTGNQNVDSLIKQYENQFHLSDNLAKEEYLKRDNLKPEYEKLLKKVEQAYKDAETIFVPTFKKLAKSFIGLDLNIEPKRSDKTIKLVLELQDSSRTESFQLSESQRFFLDIALRMSLAIFLSSPGNGATMLVDTPEGSLDIAYESRVGNMFAEFATIYKQNLFMTANINASQLLISLAKKCGKDNMKFRRMLDWTDLSIIQKEGEELFQTVYSNIENALNGKLS